MLLGNYSFCITYILTYVTESILRLANASDWWMSICFFLPRENACFEAVEPVSLLWPGCLRPIACVLCAEHKLMLGSPNPSLQQGNPCLTIWIYLATWGPLRAHYNSVNASFVHADAQRAWLMMSEQFVQPLLAPASLVGRYAKITSWVPVGPWDTYNFQWDDGWFLIIWMWFPDGSVGGLF